jgi:O-methyltransferase
MIKTLIQGGLRHLGYQLRKISKQPNISYEAFESLVRAFERLFAETHGSPLSANPRRIALVSQLQGTQPPEAYFLIKALLQSLAVPGDICEFGVAQGATSALFANEISALASERVLHLFDSFAGLPKPSNKDLLKDDIFGLGSIEKYAGMMACGEDMVVARLRALEFNSNPIRYIIHKGFIADVLQHDTKLPTAVAFGYVDFDFYEPIRDALAFLHSVTHPGSEIVVDDYDFFSTGAKAAVDEFVASNNQGRANYKLYVPDPVFGSFACLTRMA